jgi:PAS domain-containing protein
MLTTMQGDLAVTRARAATDAAQVQAMLGGVSDGVAVLDREQHLTGWNPRFAAWSTLADHALREGMLLEELLRQQIQAGRFGPPPQDIEAEVARLVAALRPAPDAGEVAAMAPDGAHLSLRARALPDGGVLLILGPADTVPTGAEEGAAADPVEW